MNIYLELFLSYAKVGVCTFGGGYAMLPLLRREIVENKKWITEEELVDYYALGQCTPGVVAVNSATFVGYKIKGTLGSIIATLGVIMPSILIITVLATAINAMRENEYVSHAFSGISIAVCALVSVTVFKLALKNVKNVSSAVIAVLAFLGVAFFGVSPILIVCGASLWGILRYATGKKKK